MVLGEDSEVGDLSYQARLAEGGIDWGMPNRTR